MGTLVLNQWSHSNFEDKKRLLFRHVSSQDKDAVKKCLQEEIDRGTNIRKFILDLRCERGMSLLDPWYSTPAIAVYLLSFLSGVSGIPLFLAVQWLSVEKVKEILESFSDQVERDNYIMETKGYHNRNCLDYCESGEMVRTVLHYLSKEKHDEFISHPNAFGRTAIFDFVMYNRLDPLKEALAACSCDARKELIEAPGSKSTLTLKKLLLILNVVDDEVRTLLGITDEDEPDEDEIIDVFDSPDGRVRNTPLLYAIASGKMNKVIERILQIKCQKTRYRLLQHANDLKWCAIRASWGSEKVLPRGEAGFWGNTITFDAKHTNYKVLKLLCFEFSAVSMEELLGKTPKRVQVCLLYFIFQALNKTSMCGQLL